MKERQITTDMGSKEIIDAKPGDIGKQVISAYDQLPVALNANQVAAALGISRAGAYNLMRSKGFPTLFIGKRMIVPKDKFLAWINEQTKA